LNRTTDLEEVASTRRAFVLVARGARPTPRGRSRRSEFGGSLSVELTAKKSLRESLIGSFLRLFVRV
jgi:hypothetical protein